jgi:CubicO group peptidase (beta-lactamase class C family)
MVEELIENHKNVIVALFANPYVMNSFSNLHKAKAVVVAYEDNKLTQEYTSQLIFGGIKAKGKLPVSVNSNFKAGMGVFTTVTRLKYGNPLEENMNPQILSKIDSLAQNGINEKAYPGCQVLVARNGNIVYQKSFGYHTYEKKNPVLNEDLYDLASITKVAASVPALMKLVDDKKINLDYSLCDYLDYVKDTEYENMNIRRMLAHTAGLVSWIPFYNKTLSRGQLKLDVYNSSFSEEYNTKVADNLYIKPSFKDSIRYWITNHGIHKKKEYRYSDLGYYFYKDIIEKQISKPMDVVLDSFLYKPLGAISLTYNPLKRFDKNEIIPTENDMIFRKRLIHGYVHDPGAAMIGGVAGHAGLFSNANDLAKLFQMYLNWGVYGSQKFVTKEVIEEFIKCQYCKEDNRRGAGFDKPSTTEAGPTCTCVSYASFGHTGFTGTMVWADPDEDIIYIFLSNRVYPDAENKKLVRMNIRTDIQSVIYESIIK